ncbi:ABC transporter ATP-binding protein [Malacoplasma penetrans]|uniref:Oligopeptide ABC transporter ATP-binding protein n=1 Tax=Malacoplasma penetrans (strain HF-2) TaxID=272633 RepID=Q8EUP5_MALP2|nr:oligopeptide ABC transporter ATP-binding protein [Malacoplasma penetrans HF-2]
MPLSSKHLINDSSKLLKENQIIKVRNLKVNFKVKDGLLQAVRGIDLSVYKGQIIGIVGESGSGKSVSVKSLIGFNDGANIEANNLNLSNIDILKIKKKDWCYIRGTYVSYIPQDPLMSLNPTKTIGRQVIEAIYASEKNKYKQKVYELKEKMSCGGDEGIELKRQLNEKTDKYNEILKSKKEQFDKDKRSLKESLDNNSIDQEAYKSSLKSLEEQYKESVNNATNVYNETKNTLSERIKQLSQLNKGNYEAEIQEAKNTYINNTKKDVAKKKVIEILEFIGIENAVSRLNAYPHEFSGGMRQRIVIAIAVATQPDVIIADEPTTALDVTIQAKVLSLIKKLREIYGITVIFISHNIALVANFCDYIYVMYAGKIVEQGLTEEIFTNPLHPYTWALLESIPDSSDGANQKLKPIDGTPPNLVTPPKGDAFAARNKYAIALDFEKQPPLFEVTDTHRAATWLLHPKAPKVEVPKEVQEKINKSKKAFEIYVKQKKENQTYIIPDKNSK